MKKIDIIIPTYKPNKDFLTLIDKLQSQTMPISNFIILNTEEKYWNQLVYYENNKIDSYRNLRVTHCSKREFDHGNTRNRGMRRSTADIVICMTQDAMPVDEFLVESLVKALDNEEAAISYARQLPAKTSSDIEKVARVFNYPDKAMVKSKEDIQKLGIKTYFCSNVCAAYRKDIYEKLGGFTKHTIFNEDMIFAATAINAGYKIAYVPEAKVVHSHDYTNMQQFRRNFDLGVSQAEHAEIFAKVPSESEGMKLVKLTRSYLKKVGKRNKIFSLYVTCAYKLIGYKLGKNYKKLPRSLVRKCSSNQEYWD